jgi:hypothetical protein
LVGVKFDGESSSGNEIAAKFGKAVSKPLQEALELAAQNAKGIHIVVYKIGKSLGKKFKPHQAKNMGKTIAKISGKLGKAIPYLAAALEFCIQIKEEKNKDKKEKHLANMRQALRNAFVDQAKLEANCLGDGIDTVSQGPVAKALKQLDETTAEVGLKSLQMEESAMKIASLMGRCTSLRNAIMGGVDAEL